MRSVCQVELALVGRALVGRDRGLKHTFFAQAVCASNPVPSEVLFGVFDAVVAAKPPVEGLPPQTFTRAPSSPT